MSLYRTIVRPLLFTLDAESAHQVTMALCRMVGSTPFLALRRRPLSACTAPELSTHIGGLNLKSPLGLAAGFDKSGHALRTLDFLGFGSIEIGSISARPSLGNRKPRLFRIPSEEAIVVHYGLPNDGAQVVAQRLARFVPATPLGVNLVATNDGPDAHPKDVDDILDDYATSFTLLHPFASYVTLNLSCPNAKEGIDFFAKPDHVARLLSRIEAIATHLPIFLKIAPTESDRLLDDFLQAIAPFSSVRGFIFNLPTGKPPTLSWRSRPPRLDSMPGAVAGRPVAAMIDRSLAAMYRRMDRSRYCLIGAGGVFSAEDAYQKIRLGASAIQLYTALVYHGPGVLGTIQDGLIDLLRRDGFSSIREAVGTGTGSSPTICLPLPAGR